MSLQAVLSALLEATQVLAGGSPIPGLGPAVTVAVSLVKTLMVRIPSGMLSSCSSIQLENKGSEV